MKPSRCYDETNGSLHYKIYVAYILLSTEEALRLRSQRRGHCNEDDVILPTRQRSPELFRKLFCKDLPISLFVVFLLEFPLVEDLDESRDERFAVCFSYAARGLEGCRLMARAETRRDACIDLACLLSWDTYSGAHTVQKLVCFWKVLLGPAGGGRVSTKRDEIYTIGLKKVCTTE